MKQKIDCLLEWLKSIKVKKIQVCVGHGKADKIGVIPFDFENDL